MNEQLTIIRKTANISNRKLDAFKFTYGISDEASAVNPTLFNALSSPLPRSSKNIDPLSELAAINKELTRNRQFFTENDPSIQRLQRRRAILQYIDQTGGGLISIASGGSKNSIVKSF